MNELTIINNFIIDSFDVNNLVNTISIVPTIAMDINQENIYPLVNIDLKNSDVNEQEVIGEFEITVVQQRDTRPIKLDNKLLSNTNYLDNVNETHSILQKFINKLLLQNNDENIEIVEQSTIRILKEWSRNNLDGVQVTMNLSIPNKGSSC